MCTNKFPPHQYVTVEIFGRKTRHSVKLDSCQSCKFYEDEKMETLEAMSQNRWAKFKSKENKFRGTTQVCCNIDSHVDIHAKLNIQSEKLE